MESTGFKGTVTLRHNVATHVHEQFVCDLEITN